MPNVIPTVETPISRQYIGARYIPLQGGAWDTTKEYAPLTVVYYQGASYTSRTYVPSGIDITNEVYWALSADYNAQVSAYRAEVLNYAQEVSYLSNYVTPEMFGAAADGATDDTEAIQKALDTGKPVLLSASYKVSSDNTALSYALLLPDNAIIIGTHNAELIMSEVVTKGRILHKAVTTAGKVIIKNITFKGSASYSTDDESGLVAVELLNASGEITGCTFTGFNKNIEIGDSNNVVISKNIILDGTETASKINGYGVLIEGSNNIVISENKINVERHCVYLNGAEDIDVHDNVLTGQINDLDRYSHQEGNIKLIGTKNTDIHDNIIIGNYYGVMIGKSFTTTLGCKNVHIRHNRISDLIENSGFAFGGIIYNYESPNTVIEGLWIDNNIIENAAENGAYHGISISRTAADDIKDLHITNNVIDGFTRGINLATIKPTELSNNVVKNCTLGYRFDSAVPMYFYGNENYYDNCTTAHELNTTSIRYSTVKGLYPYVYADKTISGSDNVIDPMEARTFNGSGGTTVKSIAAGFQGQKVTFRSVGAGGLQINVADVTQGIKIKSDFGGTSDATITFQRIDTAWYEVGRTSV